MSTQLNFSFRTRVLAGSLLGPLIVVVAVGVALLALNSVSGRFDDLLRRDVARAQAVNDMYAQALQMGQALRNIVLDAKNERAYRNLDDAAKAYAEAAARAEALAGDAGRSVALLGEIRNYRVIQQGIQQRILGLVKSGSADATHVLNKEETPNWRELRTRLLELLAAEQATLTERRASVDSHAGAAIRTAIAVGVISLLLTVAGAVSLLRYVRRAVGGDFEQALAAMQRVADGDLVQPIAQPHSTPESLLGRLQQFQDTLCRVLGKVQSGTVSVSQASREIAQGNADLSQRTEEQASSLEQTASSMEELTSTVKQNAENAKQANQLAAGASLVAVKGGEVVGQVVSTMTSINESSKKIVDIIGVIDGIAFQTNILALNAAVEAARAGEQGRGFAVVASEVRSLAQRSAAAAKEIKELISDSVHKVEDGTRLVDEAGRTMNEIVTSVKRVTDIMAEISAASREQSSGIEQVNRAVTQMDETTQQNAALVEQASAAAEALEEQARSLSGAVAIFRLAGGEAGAVRPAQAGHAAASRAQLVVLPGAHAPRAAADRPARARSVSGAPQAKTAAAAAAGGDWEEF